MNRVQNFESIEELNAYLDENGMMCDESGVVVKPESMTEDELFQDIEDWKQRRYAVDYEYTDYLIQ